MFPLRHRTFRSSGAETTICYKHFIPTGFDKQNINATTTVFPPRQDSLLITHHHFYCCQPPPSAL